MADLLEDIVTTFHRATAAAGRAADAFNKHRYAFVDGFEADMYANQEELHQRMEDWIASTEREYGGKALSLDVVKDVRFSAHALEFIYEVGTGIIFATLIDPLRIGAGVKKGGLGGYFEDALRVVGIASMGGPKLLKYASYVGRTAGVGRAIGSCVPTSAAKAFAYSRLSSVVTVEQMAQGSRGVGGAMVETARAEIAAAVRGKDFVGMTYKELIPNLVKAGVEVEQKAVSTLGEIRALVNQNRGPVLIKLEVTSAGGSTTHSMMAYRPFFLSDIRFADQFGNLHTIKEVKTATGNFLQLVYGPGSTAKGVVGSAKVAWGQEAGIITHIFEEAYVVRDSVLLDVAAHLPWIQRLGIPLYQATDRHFWHKAGYLASMSPHAPPPLKKVGDEVRRASKARASAKGSPPAHGALSPDARQLLAILAPAGTRYTWKTYGAKLRAAGKLTDNESSALGELESHGLVQVVRVHHGGNDLIESIIPRR